MSKSHEQETILRWSVAEPEIVGWTADPRTAKKWQRFGWPVEVDGEKNGRARSWKTKVPATAMSIRRKTSWNRKNNMTEAQKTAARERMKNMHRRNRL